MKARFSFGKSGMDVAIPDHFRSRLILSHSAQPLADEQAAIANALDAPIAGPPLVELARGKRSAAISVCDITRPAPNSRTLPAILERLHQSGIAQSEITILIATGLHRGATPDEVVAILGSEIAAKYRVVSHDAKALDEHRSLGETSRGTPVYIDERFMAADLHITLGFIEQHLMLGFSGGRKLIAPGLAAQETIKVLHSPRFMREPLAREGSIAHNPLHAELLEIARMARHDFILDVTLAPQREDGFRPISGVFAGDPVAAHAAGVAFVERTYLERLDEQADAVITSAAGHPLDLTFYQCVKGITAAANIVKPGGRILVIGQCAEGVGSPEFARKLATLKSFEAFLDEIRNAPVEVDQWQLEKLALVGQQHELYFFTPGVTRGQLGFLGESAYGSIQEALAATLAGLPDNALVALVPEGPYTFARAEEPAIA